MRKQYKSADGDAQFFKPDFSQMVPFKPKIQWTPGEHIAPGGCFPTPPLASQLCSMLPPPGCFHGPFVIIDQLMEKIKHAVLPEFGECLKDDV